MEELSLVLSFNVQISTKAYMASLLSRIRFTISFLAKILTAANASPYALSIFSS